MLTLGLVPERSDLSIEPMMPYKGLEAVQAGQPVLTIAILHFRMFSAPSPFRESRKLWLHAEVSQGKRLSCTVMSLAASASVHRTPTR